MTELAGRYQKSRAETDRPLILATERDMRRCGLCRLPLSECDCPDEDETEDDEESD